jgi:hypothetical protein
MTEWRIDELLDEHVPAFEPRSDGWVDVLARARTTRRRYAALAVAALALLLVPAAVALRGQIADLFQGSPAPPAVSTSFESFNRLADMAIRKGFARHFSIADVSEAHGVIEIQTSDGPQDLWAAPNDQGGVCWFIDFANDPARDGGQPGFGACDTSTSTPPSNIEFEGPAWIVTHPSLSWVDGRVYVDAETVQLTLADGSAVNLPVVEGFFLGSLDKGAKVTEVTAYDKSGAKVAQLALP